MASIFCNFKYVKGIETVGPFYDFRKVINITIFPIETKKLVDLFMSLASMDSHISQHIFHVL